MSIELAIVKQKYAPYGGAERVISAAVEALAANRDIHVSILCRSWPNKTTCTLNNCRIIRCNPPYLGKTMRESSFIKAVTRHIPKYDLVQAHEAVPGAHLYRAGSGLHEQWLMELTRELPAEEKREILAAKRNRATIDLERSTLEDPNLRAVIANSAMVVQDIARLFPNFDSSKIHLIWNGVNHSKFSPQLRLVRRSQARTRLGLKDINEVLLLFGSGWHRKGVSTALRALARLPSHVVLILAGKESHMKRYQRLSSELGIDQERLRWIGPCSDPLSLYAAADLFILPSLYDQMPNVALEAMACGLPVVVSSTSGTRDLITDGEQGFVCDWWSPKEWVEPILQCLSERTLMGEKAFETALPFSFDRMIQEWINIYSKLLS
jgi:UDP-glucose:(heptosyl)LPS alpha-1,3-glucosyltransferase